MKRKTKFLLIIGILFALLLMFPLFAYDVSLSYGEFVFQGLEKGTRIDNPEDYLLDEKYDEYRVDNVIVIPQVKRIGGDQYAVDFIVFASNKEVNVVISHVSFSNNECAILIPSDEKALAIRPGEKESNKYFEGAERFCVIPANKLNAVNGEKYKLVILLYVENPDGRKTEKYMTYYANVVQYKTLVFPT